MIERRDVIRCDNIRTLIPPSPRAGTVIRCDHTVVAAHGVKAAMRAAFERGWIELRTPEGHRRHLCPGRAQSTHGGRRAVLAEAGAR